MNIEIVNPITSKGWDSFVLKNSDCTFFHTSDWAQVLYATYGYKPLYFMVKAEGVLLALIPMMEVNSFLTGKRGVSLPFADICRPIIDAGLDEYEIWDALIEYGIKAGWKYTEIRGGGVPDERFAASSHYFEHILELFDDPEKNFRVFRESKKRNIRRAEKSGVQIEICKTSDSMEDFCHLNAITRKRHGLPPQPQLFFEKILSM